MQKRSKEEQAVERELTELVYLLLVKASTLPVFVQPATTRDESGFVSIYIFPPSFMELVQLYGVAANFDVFSKRKGFDYDITTKKFHDLFYRLCQQRGAHPSDYDFFHIMAQVDVCCSVEENLAADEWEYIKHNLNDIYATSGPLLERYRLFLYRLDRERDQTQYLSKEPGWQRRTADLTMLIARERD